MAIGLCFAVEAFAAEFKGVCLCNRLCEAVRAYEGKDYICYC